MISNSTASRATMTKKFDEFNADDRMSVRFQESGVHFLVGEINEDNINQAIKWIVFENIAPLPNRVLTLYINSPGGDLYQTLALIDMMSNSQIPVRTIGFGNVMSSAFLILSSGARGERYIAQHTGIMCHQFSSCDENGKYHNVKATRKESDRLNRVMQDILKHATGLELKAVKSKLLPAHDVYMTAEEMIEVGAVDHILNKGQQ
jgi:ATP-dependent Clp protease protease subunit